MSSNQVAGDETVKPVPTPFLTKTYFLVDDHASDAVISWNEDGSTFIVWNPAEFARDLCPKFFKHNNFASFVRQLNTYGFRKIVPDRWEFTNAGFRRGQQHLLCDIQRRKVPMMLTSRAAPPPPPPPAVVVDLPTSKGCSSNSVEEQANYPTSKGCSSNSVEEQTNYPSPTISSNEDRLRAELIDENHMLARENGALNRELNHMQDIFNNVLSLLWNHRNKNNEEEQISRQETIPLDLFSYNSQMGEMSIPMEMERSEVSPEIFEETAEQSGGEVQLQLGGADGKCYPFDSSGGGSGKRWKSDGSG